MLTSCQQSLFTASIIPNLNIISHTIQYHPIKPPPEPTSVVKPKTTINWPAKTGNLNLKATLYLIKDTVRITTQTLNRHPNIGKIKVCGKNRKLSGNVNKLEIARMEGEAWGCVKIEVRPYWLALGQGQVTLA